MSTCPQVPKAAPRRHLVLILPLVLAAAILCAAPAAAKATTLVPMQLDDLVAASSMIVQGSVLSVAAEETHDGVRTAVRLRVD